MRNIVILVMVVVLGLAVMQCAFAAERAPAGSYLIYRATTVGELRDQIAKNPIVRSRYVRHFGKSAAELDKFLSRELALTSLKEPLRAKCWYIDKSGRQLIKTKLLPRGSMVFTTSDGKPLLSWSCGNPLRADLPTKLVKSSVQTISKQQIAKATPGDDVETKVLANPIETISTAVIAAVPAPVVVAALPIEAVPAMATIAAPAVSVAPFISAGGSSLGWLGMLGGVAAGVANAGGDRTIVPEPSSVVALSGMICLLPGAYRLSRRKK